MCGIAGAINDTRDPIMTGMLDRIRHRGPDDRGQRSFDDLMMGNVRLSVIDLPGGHQPMADASGQVWTVFNGELYGYRQARDELVKQGCRFRTCCDTELIPTLYRTHGLEFLHHLDGMFAFCLYDAPRSTVVLARDPFGIKPLVYTVLGQRLYFASEVKALYAVPEWRAAPDWDAWHTFLNVRFPPSPHTLFRDVTKIPAGCCLVLHKGEAAPDIPSTLAALRSFGLGPWKATLYRYYSVPDLPEHERDGHESDRLRSVLSRSVHKQLVADVDTGVYLSGGLDSSTLVALGSEGDHKPLNTLCLGFNEPSDENTDAALVAQRFGTTHRDLFLDEQPLSHFRQALYFLEEPKVNGLQGFLLAREARKHQKVMLSGLGGDELFGGYDVYQIAAWLDAVGSRAGSALCGLAGSALDLLLRALPGLRMDNARRAASLARSLRDPLGLYLLLRNGWDHDPAIRSAIYRTDLLRNQAAPVCEHFAASFPSHGALVRRFMRFELGNKMVDDFLANEDKTSMAHGLEVRVPYLDKKVVEYALGLPQALKVGLLSRKAALRGVARNLLPPRIMTKRKHGFTFNPVLQFQRDLGGYAARYLTRERVESSGVFNFRFIQRVLQSRPSPALRWHYFLLWKILGFHLWEEVFIKNGGKPDA